MPKKQITADHTDDNDNADLEPKFVPIDQIAFAMAGRTRNRLAFCIILHAAANNTCSPFTSRTWDTMAVEYRFFLFHAIHSPKLIQLCIFISSFKAIRVINTITHFSHHAYPKNKNFF